jgi:HlyD family secretion protein
MNKKIFQKKIIIPVLLILTLAGYFGYTKFLKKSEVSRYVLTQAEKGTILVSVSGSGQVSPEEQKEIKPKVSGEVLKIYVEDNQKVKSGDLLLELDPETYQRAIDDANLVLDNARTSLGNLKKNKEDAQKDLSDNYENAFNLISDAFNSLPQVIQTIEPIFTENSYSGTQGDIDYYRGVIGFYSGQSFPNDEKENQFLRIKNQYQINRDKFILLSKSAPRAVLEEWLADTANLVKEIADFTRSGRDIISFYKETLQNQSLTPSIPLTTTESQLTTLTTITASLDQKATNLSSLSKTIDQLKTSISNYDDNIQSQEKTVEQKENALTDAKENYENCFIKAPYDGIVAKVNIKEGDSVSSQTSLFTFISTQKIAEITLNEIDAAKVEVGQKVTLTFDALPDLTLTGKVTEIDTVGTVSQGVTSYGVKIALDTDSEKIKPGMSVTAEIVVEAKPDVLVLPNSAIKTQGDSHYVELIEAPEEVKSKLKIGSSIVLAKEVQIKNQPVEIGISNDLSTEIISGLKEGDIVISSKITQTAQTTQTTQKTSTFQIPGIGGEKIKINR